MIILNLITEHDSMAAVVLFHIKLIKTKILKKGKMIIKCLVSALNRSSDAPSCFLKYLAYSLSQPKRFYGLLNLNLQLLYNTYEK